MKHVIRKIINRFQFFLNKNYPKWFYKDFAELKTQEQVHRRRFLLDETHLFPCTKDKTASTGFDRHYIYHPAWAAQIIAKTKPVLHTDLSSTLHFSTMLSAFVITEFYDYRPAKIELDNFTSLRADLTKLLFPDNSKASISCMHTIEHIGLGRYGDPINYDGDIDAMHELARVLAPNGNLLIVVPVGKENIIHFNAHRVYTAKSIYNQFEEYGLKLVEFAYINQYDGGLIKNSDINTFETSDKYGCGCFWFTKA